MNFIQRISNECREALFILRSGTAGAKRRQPKAARAELVRVNPARPKTPITLPEIHFALILSWRSQLSYRKNE